MYKKCLFLSRYNFSTKFSQISYSVFCENFAISEKTGVLMDSDFHLPTKFNPWYSICEELSNHISNNSIKKVVEQLPLLQTKELQTHNEIIAGITLIMRIKAAYVWHKLPPPQSLPKQLAIPFVELATKIGVPPVYSGLEMQYNWKKIENSEINIVPKYTWTKDEGEKIFFGISQTSSVLFSRILQNLYKANCEIEENNVEKLIEALKNIRETLKIVIKNLKFMYIHNEPNFYYFKLRPYLFGFSERDFPNGMYFEGVDKFIKEEGASAGQDPTFHIFDSAMGICYEGQTQIRCQKLMKAISQNHINLINFYRNNSKIRNYAKVSSEVKNVYNEILEEYAKFFKVVNFLIVFFSIMKDIYIFILRI